MFFLAALYHPPLTTESPTTHYCTVQHHVPIDPYAERMPRADYHPHSQPRALPPQSRARHAPRWCERPHRPSAVAARRCVVKKQGGVSNRIPATATSRGTARATCAAPATSKVIGRAFAHCKRACRRAGNAKGAITSVGAVGDCSYFRSCASPTAGLQSHKTVRVRSEDGRILVPMPTPTTTPPAAARHDGPDGAALAAGCYDVFVDVGANIGLHARYSLSRSTTR